jgi:SAM-dependent methyltransferase
MQDSLDAMMAPAAAELKARVGSVSGQRVLDIGCGSGETCSTWLAGGADVTGVDVSEAMLAVAASRTKGKVKLIQADASVWKAESLFDLAVSQFGVMFFADPDVAFEAIAANIRPGGRLLFTCWRQIKENSWVTTPMSAVRDLLPESAPLVPQAPGPFALSDRDRLQRILERAGFADITITPFDFPVCVATAGGAEAAVRFVMQIGPTSVALAEVGKETRALAAERLKAALALYESDGVVMLGGAMWMVEAVRSA